MSGAHWEKLSIGSDESGKGDFFGGPVVVAVRLDQETLENLKKLPIYRSIQDSKKCSDDWILRHAETIMDCCRYEKIELAPEEYNRQYAIYRNMNSLLAHLHNELHSRIEGDDFRVVDAFAKKELYMGYLRETNTPYVDIDAVVEKADSSYLSVAIASIIARYFFITQIRRLRKESGFEYIPFGNAYSPEVNSVVEAYLSLLKPEEGGREAFGAKRRYSRRELDSRFVKSHFATMKKIEDRISASRR